ncbi:PREDICTED: MMS19 nucleotide excision repair protein homolog isoform X2 [Tarenaya hassleriana]|uniref:MMS19 nucleotide excision repair protein homolog isoform X2 n=1 Tax=Tarenaya hassleriana TaxID=28532 RepID=UPI00053C8BEE|nr:PREDICTED: MMS19 nucleotide excision repair protein homolog isoform X2 [Tarenaya hassleriana]
MTEPSQLVQHLETFVDVARSPTQQAASLEALVSAVEKNALSMQELVREMELYLTTTDNVVRARGILLLAEVLKYLEAKPLEGAVIHSLIGFFTERLADWRALRGALVGCLALLGRKGAAGVVTDTDAEAVANSFLQNLQVQSLAQHDRKLCFELLECLLEGYPEAVKSMGDMLVYGTCEAIDGEKDPQCLMIAFHIIELLAQLFPDPSGPVASNAADLFDVMGCYFPLHFTHEKDEEACVKRDTLSRALMLAFSSTPLFEPFSIPLLLEKLSSSLELAKVDSLKYLHDCALKYGANRMVKHYKGLWSSLKETIYSSIETHLSFAPESLTGPGAPDEGVQKEALNLLQSLVMQDASFLSFVVGDIDIDIVFDTISSYCHFKEMLEESKRKVLAISEILSVSAKASASSCNKIFEIVFFRILKALGILEKNSEGDYIPQEDSTFSGRLNQGGLFLCIGLLTASKDHTLSSKEHSMVSSCGHEMWCSMVNRSAFSLIQMFSSAAASFDEDDGGADAYLGVKGLLTLGMLHGGSSLLSRSIFDKVLITLTSIITAECGKTLAWKLALKALVYIGSFIDRYHETEKTLTYMNIVVDKFVMLACSDHVGMPYSLILEAASDICLTGPKHVHKIIQGFEEALCANWSDSCVRGNSRSIENCVLLLDCFSNKLLPRLNGVVEIDDLEDILLQFAVSIWNKIETCRVFSCTHGKELIDPTMMAMRQVVAISSVETQNTIIQKAYSVVLSSTLPLMESIPSKPVALEALKHFDLSIRDELILSLFASTIIAASPTTDIPNVKSVVHLFLVTLLRGHLPAAQALGSIVNKLGSGSRGTKISSTSSLEEAYKIIFHTTFEVGKSLYSDGSGESSSGSEINLTKFCFGDYDGMNLQNHAITGLAWIGKGLLMRGDERACDIALVLLDCLKTTDSSGQVLQSSSMRCAADAFRILMCDSDICLSRKFHAVIRPLYKQWFFSKTFPILESSIVKPDTPLSRIMLYLAFTHVVSNVPTVVILDNAKKLYPLTLEGLSILIHDPLGKDAVYSLLLVLSGLLTDKKGP